jgi:glyoxylase-like metal-dependent hydrolase (beta-lactamase superfamily II)
VNGYLISGDTLFFGSIGRTDGNTLKEAQKLRRLELASIREKLFKLPGTTRVLPGHGLETILDREKQYNPFLAKKIEAK